ncbi:hypothetical protein SO802_008559 [Lithocarpus litseifolius]|uniref:Ataxin-2 C-terminal domain-containing protein n=1 Tax=Lithocarpus litseifolius TaxID=425828 RepID=A0AAW2D909_9ROSI
MALVSGERSTLNPNAPAFIPATFYQVEDFSSEWWELVKTSTWFRDFWLSQHQDDDFEGNIEVDTADAEDNDDGRIDYIFNHSIDEAHLTELSQLEEIYLSHKDIGNTGLFPPAPKNENTPLNDFEEDAKAFLKKLSVSKSPKERGPKSPAGPAKYQQKPVRYVSPKCTPRLIHQPR